MNSDQLRDASLLELFALEAESQAGVLNAGLLALEREPTAAVHLEACMRAAHSLKGAARIVGLDGGVRLAHAMEDCLVAAQGGCLLLAPEHIDALLTGTDLLQRIGAPPDGDVNWAEHAGKVEIDAVVARLNALLDGADTAPAPRKAAQTVASVPAAAPDGADANGAAAAPDEATKAAEAIAATEAAEAAERADPRPSGEQPERMLRVTADNIDRLLGLSGEALVESHWLKPFGDGLQQTRRLQMRAMQALDRLQSALGTGAAEMQGMAQADTNAAAMLAEARRLLDESHRQLTSRAAELELFDHRAGRLSRRLYDTALASRMRPLSDGIGGYSRMVRDLARSLGKQARLEIVGEGTQVDRDILERLEAPLGHLLRNAIDHGIEAPGRRREAGKPVEGRITLAARQSAGRLLIDIGDDGAGVDLHALRNAVVLRGLASEDTASRLSQAELLEFLLLPGFSMREAVSEVSGRGVGLDAVRDMIRQVRGKLRISQQTGQGMRFQLELPLTLSVVRALLVEVAGEAYAFPLAFVARAASVEPADIQQLENHEHFHFRYGDRHVGLVSAAQILGRPEPPRDGRALPVVVVGEHERTYGIAVDRMLGERVLVVQPLAPALGKIKDIAAASLAEDGTPVLIFDVEDMVRSVERLLSEGRVEGVRRAGAAAVPGRRKRVLVVDDSLTVRELERKLLTHRGFDVAVAVDGMDGWNQLRAEAFDLVITDIDMPRMDGIELVGLIKQDARLRQLPVMVVSYKDREQDRQRGLEAGADYYLAKSSFHDAALLDAVHDLIGEAQA